MLSASALAGVAAKLQDAGSTPEERLSLAQALRDSPELTHGADYSAYLSTVLPSVTSVLSQEGGCAQAQRTRSLLLDLLARLPQTEALRPHAETLLRLCAQLLVSESEEGALTALRVTSELHKAYRPTLEHATPPFLDAALRLLANFPNAVAQAAQASVAAAPPAAEVDEAAPRSTTPALCSFRLLTDLPLIQMFLYQLYPKTLSARLPQLLAALLAVICTDPPPGFDSPTAVPPHARAVYGDMRAAQSKAVSFVTFLLRAFGEQLREHGPRLAAAIVRLMAALPDSVGVRKELLVAVRHLLSTELKHCFRPHFEGALLQERVLLGESRQTRDALRPLAFSLVAEVLSCCEGAPPAGGTPAAGLSLPALHSLVSLFGASLRDSTLAMQVHTMTVRLLLALVEPLYSPSRRAVDAALCQTLLATIAQLLCQRTAALHAQLPALLSGSEGAGGLGGGRAGVAACSGAREQREADPALNLAEAKALLKSCLGALKTVLWSLSHFAPPPGGSAGGTAPPTPPFPLPPDLLHSVSRVLLTAIHPQLLPESCELLAGALSPLHRQSLHEALSSRLPAVLLPALAQTPQLLALPHALLSHPNTAGPTCAVLVQLVTRPDSLKSLGHPESPLCTGSMKLWSLVLHVVTKSQACEQCLRPQLCGVVTACLATVRSAPDPSQAVRLLRYLFRALGHAQLEGCTKELQPILVSTLESLTQLLAGPELRPAVYDSLLELILSLPARLSTLLPHLPRVMPALCLALKGGYYATPLPQGSPGCCGGAPSSELQMVAMRKLESWVDNLAPEYLEPVLAPFQPQLFAPLWSLLRGGTPGAGGTPQGAANPQGNAIRALQLLGKLGSRGRCALREDPACEWRPSAEQGLRAVLTFSPSTTFLVPLDRVAGWAKAAVLNAAHAPEHAQQRAAAVQLARAGLTGVMGVGATSAEALAASLLGAGADTVRAVQPLPTMDCGAKTGAQLAAEQAVLRQQLCTLVWAQSEASLRSESDDFAMHVVRHAAALLVTAAADAAHQEGSSAPAEVPAVRLLTPSLVFDALLEALCEGSRTQSSVAAQHVAAFYETAVMLVAARAAAAPGAGAPPRGPKATKAKGVQKGDAREAPDAAAQPPFPPQLLALFQRLLHACHGVAWGGLLGGLEALSGTLKALPQAYLSPSLAADVAQAILAALRSLPEQCVEGIATGTETLLSLSQSPAAAPAPDQQPDEPPEQSLVGVCALELASAQSCAHARSAAQQALNAVAAATSTTAASLLTPLVAQLWGGLAARPLAGRPLVTQAQVLCSLCFATEAQLLPPDEPFLQRIEEALALCEADAECITPAGGPACALLSAATAFLAAALALPTVRDGATAASALVRTRTVALFFKTLTAAKQHAERTASASLAIRAITLTSRLPKQLLTDCLRPVLQQLAHPKNLSLPLVAGLRRLLSLLAGFFNQTLAEKLLEHLRRYAGPTDAPQEGLPARRGGAEDVALCGAILDLFPLLPDAAARFLPDLVTVAAQLELCFCAGAEGALVPGGCSLDVPVAAFLERHADEAAAWLLSDDVASRLSDAAAVRRYRRAAKAGGAGGPLVASLVARLQSLLPLLAAQADPPAGDAPPPPPPAPVKAEPPGAEKTAAASRGRRRGGVAREEVAPPEAPAPAPPAPAEPPAGDAGECAPACASCDGALALLCTLASLDAAFLGSPACDALVATLAALFTGPGRLQRARASPLSRESKRLAKLLVAAAKQRPGDLSLPRALLHAFCGPPLLDLTAAHCFFAEAAGVATAQGVRALLVEAVADFTQLQHSPSLAVQERLAVGLQVRLTPALSALFARGGAEACAGVLEADGTLAASLVATVLDPPAPLATTFTEPLRCELLQLSTLLLKSNTESLQPHRKELISAGWRNLKSEGPPRWWAFLNVATFLDAFTAPDKIILQVYVALLRAAAPDSRALVRAALDVLLPALPRRLPDDVAPAGTSQAPVPIWVRYIRRILQEEGHSTPHVAHLWSLVVRHQAMFYPHRALFVPHMVTSLARLAHPGGGSSENKALAVDMLATIVSWEKQRRDAASAPPPEFADSPVESAAPVGGRAKRQGGSLEKGESKAARLSPTQAAPSPGEASPEEWSPTAQTCEMLVNFLCRLCFMLGSEAGKDPSLLALQTKCYALVSEALALWDCYIVRLGYVEKLLAGGPADVAGAVGTALQLLPRVLAGGQGASFLASGGTEVLCGVVDAALAPQFRGASGEQLSQLTALSLASAPDSAPLAARLAASAARTVGALAAASSLAAGGASLASALSVLGALADVAISSVEPHAPALLKLLARAVRETPAGSAQPGGASGEDSAAAPPLAATLLTLLCRTTIPNASPEHRQATLRMLAQLLSDRNASHALLSAALTATCAWVAAATAPAPPAGSLSAREAAELLRRCAAISRPEGALASSGASVSQNAAALAWEVPLLDALYAALTCPHDGWRAEVWPKVESAFLVGARARDPDTRRRFFDMHNAAVGAGLAERLRFIVSEAEWEGAGDSFWLRHALELLFTSLAGAQPLLLAPNAARFPSLLPAPQQALQAVEASPEHAQLAAFCEQHAAWMSATASCHMESLLSPLRALCWSEPAICAHVWVILFPIVWTTLAKEDQIGLAKPLISLLSRDFHGRQAGTRVNCVQALLEGVSLSHPQPKIPSELVKYLGRTFNAWHVAVPLLESHVMLFPQEPRCFDALAALYQLLGEEDALFGLWRQRCHADATRAGLALQQHGFQQEAQEVWLAAASRAVRGGYATAPVTKSEMALWESQWLACCRQLAQWECLQEWSVQVDHAGVAAEACARQGHWRAVWEHCQRAPQEDVLAASLLRAQCALLQGASGEAEAASASAVRAGLAGWARLPDTGGLAHGPLLQSFQALMEVAEAGRVLGALNAGAPQGRHSQQQAGGGNPGAALGEVRQLVETWRGRVPGDWEPLHCWHDVAGWRSAVFAAVAQAQGGVAQLAARERAWLLTHTAAAARTQQQPGLALQLLHAAQAPPAADAAEAFSRTVQLLEATQELGGCEQAMSGLATLQCLDLCAVAPPLHRCELLRLRGGLLAQSGDAQGAHASFSAAAQQCRTSPELWLCWGEFCEQQAAAAAAAAAAAPALPPVEGPPDEAQAAPQAAPTPDWIAHAVTCYMQTLRHGAALPRYRRAAARVLAAAGSGGSQGFSAAAALERCAGSAPVAPWVAWLPQLLLALERAEGPQLSALLGRVAVAAPHASYFALRAYLLERRESLSRQLAAPAPDGAPQQPPPNLQRLSFAVDAAKGVRERLRARHPGLVSELEAMLSELGTRFLSTPEERLLAVVVALLQRCFRYPAPTDGEVPASLRKELAGIGRACWGADTAAKHPGFVAAYRPDFERMLEPDGPEFPATLGGLTDALRGWRERLSEAVESSLPGPLRLETMSPLLAAFRPQEAELPGGAFGGAEGSCGTTPALRLARLGPDVEVVRRGGASHRRLTFVAVDGRQRQFLVTPFGGVTPAARGEERLLQLLRGVNQLLDGHPETRRRGLQFHCPHLIPLWPQVRLLEDDCSLVPLQTPYASACARHSRDPDAPLLLFKERLNPAARGDLVGDAVLDLRLQTYTEVCSSLVSENLFSQYVYKTLPAPNHLWAFKRSFCSQLALSAFASALLRIGGRTPQKVLFSRHTGRLVQLDFSPSFDPNTQLCDSGEPVPFRVTRNLSTFLTPFAIEGCFVTALTSAAQASAAPRSCLDAQLALYFRDAVQLFPWRRALGEGELLSIAQRNVEETLGRVNQLAPRPQQQLIAPDGACPSVQRGASGLVAAALNPSNLCRCPIDWAPWF